MITTKEYNVVNIEYDYDSDEKVVNVPCPPSEMIIEISSSHDMNEAEISDRIADIISDTTGWCVFGFDFEEI